MLKHLYLEHEEAEICRAAAAVQCRGLTSERMRCGVTYVFGRRKDGVLLLNMASAAHQDTLVAGRAGEELPAKATSSAFQLLVLNAPTSPVHSPALPAALGSGSTRATGVSLS